MDLIIDNRIKTEKRKILIVFDNYKLFKVDVLEVVKEKTITKLDNVKQKFKQEVVVKGYVYILFIDYPMEIK